MMMNTTSSTGGDPRRKVQTLILLKTNSTNSLCIWNQRSCHKTSNGIKNKIAASNFNTFFFGYIENLHFEFSSLEFSAIQSQFFHEECNEMSSDNSKIFRQKFMSTENELHLHYFCMILYFFTSNDLKFDLKTFHQLCFAHTSLTLALFLIYSTCK